MVFVNIVSVVITMAMLFLVFKKHLPKTVTFKEITAKDVIKDKKLSE